MQPINYSLDVVNPFQAALQGFQTGAGIQQVQQAQQDRLLAAQQAQQAMEAKAAEQARVQAIRQRYESSTEPMGYRDVIQYASTFDPAMVSAAKELFTGLGAEGGKKELAKVGKLLSAIRVNPQVAQSMLDEQITAARNANDSEEVQRLELLKQTVETNPEMALRGIAPQVAALGKEGQDMLASLFGAEETAAKTAETVAKTATEREVTRKTKTEADFAVQQEQAKLALNKANISNLNNQIADRAAQRQIDRQRLALETTARIAEIQSKGMEIPEHAQKLVNESATKATANKLAAEQQLNLATNLEKLGGGYGAFGSASEFIKKSLGAQDAMTQLRAEYTRLRNTGAMKYIPPGPATDKDIQMALEGFLPPNASAKQLASFLRGMAKISEMDAALENSKTDWLTNNKGQLGRARTSFIAGDLAVKPGESFTDFSTRAAKAVAEKYKTPAQRIEEARVNSAALIPTRDATPTTARPVSSIRAQADAILSGGQ